MFDVGKRYSFLLKDIVEKGTERHVRGKVIEFKHPLVEVEEIDGKIVVLNLSSSQFVSASPSP
jgi:hypothetical protein